MISAVLVGIVLIGALFAFFWKTDQITEDSKIEISNIQGRFLLVNRMSEIIR